MRLERGATAAMRLQKDDVCPRIGTACQHESGTEVGVVTNQIHGCFRTTILFVVDVSKRVHIDHSNPKQFVKTAQEIDTMGKSQQWWRQAAAMIQAFQCLCKLVINLRDASRPARDKRLSANRPAIMRGSRTSELSS